jgi:ATP-dependent DNA ligase
VPEGRAPEGVVSKRRDALYRLGKQCDWIKVKCATWREAHRERWRLFERDRYYIFREISGG